MKHCKLLLVAILLMYGAVVLFGCKKCYMCYYFRGVSMCIKGIDTIYTGSNNELNAQDSVNNYTSRGYNCYNVMWGYLNYNYPVNDDPVCGKANYDAAIANGAVCNTY